MSLTLNELLALLPDNTTGEISAADLRTIVTELYNLAATVGQVYSYSWVTNDPTPAAGKITMDQPWQMIASKMIISETTEDGEIVTFSLVDNTAAGQLWLSGAAGGKLRANVTGPSVDLGTYREIPITVTSISGAIPANNEKVSVTFVGLAG
jgi:hypothetical protein